MPKNTNALVREFHETFRAAVAAEPSLRTGFEELRFKLVREEVAETLLAIMSHDEVEFADGLGDVDYVVEGAAITFGIDLQESFDIAMLAYLKYKYYELIGLLVLSVRDLNGYLVQLKDDGDLHLGRVEAVLASIKAMIWTISAMGDKPIPLKEIIEAIHESNMSKLDVDGKPIFRADGKILKGPGYFAPTEKIKELLGV